MTQSPQNPPGRILGATDNATLADRLSILHEGSRDGLWDWDVATDELQVSRRWREILGLGEVGNQLASADWFRRIHPRDLEDFKRAVNAHLSGRTEVLEIDFRIVLADGSLRWVSCRGVARGDQSLLGGSLADITQERALESRLLKELFHDPLTGLPNKAHFLERVGQSLVRARRGGGVEVAVLHLDLDRFHHVNDSLGVSAGDQLLTEVAERVKSRMRPGDTLAHFGADKFGILMDGVRGVREAVELVESLSAVLRAPLFIDDHEIFPAGTFGVALSNPLHVRADDLLRDAVAAMHRAKDDGSLNCEVHDPEMNVTAKERLRLEGDLHHGLERDEFLLHYQPIVSFGTGKLAGFEALIRWQHPERGMVRPDNFIPIAEENGLIIPMGAWVMEEACRQLVDWRRRIPQAKDVTMAVNLSARQFDSPRLLTDVEDALQRSGLDAHGLKLEMTESVVMAPTRRNKHTLHSLRDQGIKIMIDDFGTGYSSLSALNTFPLDSLKIDRSFVNGMEHEEDKATIVKMILDLADRLHLDVVAEGVETSEQLDMLRELECEHGQGYFFSTPIDGQSAADLIAGSPSW